MLREVPLPSTGTGAGGGLVLCCLLSSPGVPGGPVLASRPWQWAACSQARGCWGHSPCPAVVGRFGAFLSMFRSPRANKRDLSILVLLALRLEFLIIVYLICSLSH